MMCWEFCDVLKMSNIFLALAFCSENPTEGEFWESLISTIVMSLVTLIWKVRLLK